MQLLNGLCCFNLISDISLPPATLVLFSMAVFFGAEIGTGHYASFFARHGLFVIYYHDVQTRPNTSLPLPLPFLQHQKMILLEIGWTRS